MKKSQYYLKDKQATIYVQRNVSQPGYMPVMRFIPITPSPLWCYTSQLSQDRIIQAKGVGSSENRFFVFNHLNNVKVDDPLFYKGNWYHITRVDTEDDYNTDTFIYVEDLDNPPEEEDILSYEEGAQYLNE